MMYAWFTEEEPPELMERLAHATRRVEIQASFAQRIDQYCITSRWVSVEYGAGAYTDFIGAREAEFTPMFPR